MQINIKIKRIKKDLFHVNLGDEDKSFHKVIITDKYFLFLTKNKIKKEELLDYSIKFLLDREKNSSILPFFDLSLINHYFPFYEKEVMHWIENIPEK